MKDGAATRQTMLSTSMSKQLFETSDSKACTFNYSAHRDRVTGLCRGMVMESVAGLSTEILPLVDVGTLATNSDSGRL
jgi:hypothetical protein